MALYNVDVECSATWFATIQVEAASAQEAEEMITQEAYGSNLLDEVDEYDIEIIDCTAEQAAGDDEEDENDEEDDDGEEESGN